MENVQPQPDPILFEEVTKTFRTGLRKAAVRALDRVSFHLVPGRIAGLVGPNGSGKTTTFRIAAGLLKPDRGHVRIHGLAPGSMDARHRTGYMPERLGLPGTLTPREIVHFVGSVFLFSKMEKRSRFDELRDLLALSGFERRRMAGLSKGQLKRVGLATALYNRPGLLLLDEPLEGLDPLGAADIKAHLKQLAKEGTAILISSHILSDVESLCDELLILNEGRICVSGPAEAILEAGKSMEVRFSMSPRDNDSEAVGSDTVGSKASASEAVGSKAGSPEENVSKAGDPEADGSKAGGSESSPSNLSMCEEIQRLIESKGGRVESAGPARRGLEDLFRDLFRGSPPPRDGEAS